MSKQATDANADFVAALNALENVSANKSNPAFKGSKYVSLDQLLDALAGHRGDVHVQRLAAPLLGDQTVIGELLLDALWLRVGQVDLVDGNDDRDLRVLRVR